MSRRGLLAVTTEGYVERERDIKKGKAKRLAFEAPAPFHFPELPDTIREVLRGERETLGMFVSGHPLDYLDQRHLQGAVPASVVRESQPGKWVTVVGIVSEAWQKPTRRGSVWGGCVLEDTSGVCTAFAFADVSTQLADGQLVRARGVTDARDDQPALKITDLKVLEEW